MTWIWHFFLSDARSRFQRLRLKARVNPACVNFLWEDGNEQATGDRSSCQINNYQV